MQDFEIDWARLDAIASGTPAPVAEDTDTTARTEAPLPVSTWYTQEMASEGARALIATEADILADHGIKTDGGELFYAAGTALAEVGHDNLRGYARSYEALPEAGPAVEAFRATIEGEARRDYQRDLVEYRLDADGRLAHVTAIAGGPNALALPNKGAAWRQLAEVAGGPNINAGLASRNRADRLVRTRAGVDNGPREAFAIVSSSPKGYQVCDGPEVADLLRRALDDHGLASGCKVRLKYDRDTTRYSIRAIVQARIDIPALWGVGRVHQAFVDISGGDDGMTAIKGQIGAMRVRCLNASLAQLDGALWTRAHKGQLSEIRALVLNSVGQFGALGESLREVWGQAAASHYLDTNGTELSVSEALTRLVAHGHIPTGGLEQAEAVDRYLAAWRAEESPTSAAGVIMAVQRAAHEGLASAPSKWATEEAETAASALLYQPVWTLAEAEA